MRRNNTSYRYLLTLLVTFFITNVFAQPSWNPASYRGIPAHDKVNLFHDDFNDGRYWDISQHNYMRQERIHRGEFYLISYAPEPTLKLREMKINTEENFELEMQFRFGSGMQYTMAGLAFGGNYQNSHYRFVLDAVGNYEISVHNRGNDRILHSGKTRQAQPTSGYRTLTMRQIDQKWYFFVSQEMVFQTNKSQFFGDRTGFRVGGNKTLVVDYYRLSRLQSSDILGPTISITEPVLNDQNNAVLNEKLQYISGRLIDQSGIRHLTINGTKISVNNRGEFSASLELPEEQRVSINMEAEDIYGNLSSKQFTMEYRNRTVYNPVPPSEYQAPRYNGDNYLLVIGVNDYQSWTPLYNAVKDCRDIVRTLTTDYQFDPQNVYTLFNSEANRENILETLESLQEKITGDDNLLVYYAGHGYFNKNTELGYWVPVGARKDKIADFIPNSTIRDYVKAIKSRNTLLIADACYSGSLLGSDRGNYTAGARSRWAFTSGDIEKVWDGTPGQNSPFARYLINYLKNNPKPELPANELIEAVRISVKNNTHQSPVGAPLKSADDEGGIFMFYRR
jgi:hypothetical protein